MEIRASASWEAWAGTAHPACHKLVGVYGAAEADAAKQRKLQFEGFRDYPECFHAAEYEIDKDAWTKGFICGEPVRANASTRIENAGLQPSDRDLLPKL